MMHTHAHGHDAHPGGQADAMRRSAAPGAAWRLERRHCRCPCRSPSASPPAHTGSTCRGASKSCTALLGAVRHMVSDTNCSHRTCNAYRRSQAFGASGMASDSCQICSERQIPPCETSPRICLVLPVDRMRSSCAPHWRCPPPPQAAGSTPGDRQHNQIRKQGPGVHSRHCKIPPPLART